MQIHLLTNLLKIWSLEKILKAIPNGKVARGFLKAKYSAVGLEFPTGSKFHISQ